MRENIVNGVYVELDCIVDTRLSLMYSIDKNVMSTMLEMDKYHDRHLDQFGYLSVKAFRKLYSLRTSSTLDNPLGTEIINVISNYCLEAIITAKSYGEFKPLTIYLNTYPYNLTEENLELIRMGLVNSTKMSNVDVEFMHEPYTEIKPSFILDNIALMIMYDGLSWIDYNIKNEELIKCNIADVTLLTPMLMHRSLIVSKKELNKIFEDIEEKLKLLVNLVYTPTKLFSFNKKEIKNL